MVSERFQLIIESLGGARAVQELEKVGNAGKTEFDKAAAAGTRAANDITSAQARVAAATEQGQARIAAATQRSEVAQLKAAQASAAVERAQAKVGESAVGTVAAARAAEALEAAQLKAAHAGHAVEAAQAKVAAATTTANKAIAASRVELAAVESATAKLSGTTGIADAALQKMGLSGVTTGAALKSGVAAGAGAAALAIGALAVKGVRDLADLAEEVDGVQDVMGGTAEEASKLLYAAKALGVGVETLANGAFKLTLNLEKNKGALAAYGVEAVKARDGSTDVYATIIAVSDAFNKLSDPVDKNRLLMLAFGKGGRELEEILSAGGARLREFAKDAERAGLVLDEAGVKKGKQFNIAMEQATLSVKGLAIGLGGGLIGGLSQAASGMANLIDKVNPLLKSVGGLAGVVESTVKAMIPGAGILGIFGSKAKDAGEAAADAAPELRGLGDASGDASPKVGLIAGSMDLLRDALDPAARELKTTGGAADDMATDLERARDAAGELKGELDRLLGGTISVEDAMSDYEEGLDDLVETLDKNIKKHGEEGRSLDLSTEAGRENAKAVRDLVGDIRDHIQALIDNGATQDQVRSQFDKHIEDFRRVLRQMGLNKAEIESLITKYGLVPESVETAVKLTGVEQAIADTERVVNHLVERFGIAQKAAEITVKIFGQAEAENQLDRAREEAGDIGKIVDSAPASEPAAEEPASRASGGLVPYARGGVRGFKTNGPRAIVGEGNQAFPEYVIATDPAYRVRNEKLWKAAGRDIKMMADGGVITEDDIYGRWDWRSMGNGQRGVWIDGQGWMLQDAQGNLSPHNLAAGMPKNPDMVSIGGGMWVPPDTVPYPAGGGGGNQTRILSSPPPSPATHHSGGTGRSGSSGGSSGINDLARVLAELISILRDLRDRPLRAEVLGGDVASALYSMRPR